MKSAITNCAICGERVNIPALSVYQRGGRYMHYCIECASMILGNKLIICGTCHHFNNTGLGCGMCSLDMHETTINRCCEEYERRRKRAK